jgi:hypothetical protein
MVTIRPPKDYANRKQKTIARLERWAENHNVQLINIPKQTGVKTPDYRAVFRDVGITLIVEVKEIVIPFDVSPEHGGVICIPEKGAHGERFKSADSVRYKIGDAQPQLKPYTSQGYPTLLLIGMWNPVLDGRLIMDIPIAMKGGGPRVVIEDAGLQIVSIAQGGIKASGDTNRSISGIGRFENRRERNRKTEGSGEIVVYRHDNPLVEFPDDAPGIKFQSLEAVFTMSLR